MKEILGLDKIDSVDEDMRAFKKAAITKAQDAEHQIDAMRQAFRTTG